MPGVDGYKLCSSIKADENLSRPIVVAITAMGDAEVEERARQAGADGFLRKPIDLDTLPNLIEELAEARATRRE